MLNYETGILNNDTNVYSNYDRPHILIIEDDLSLVNYWHMIIKKISPNADVIWAENDLEAEIMLIGIHEQGGELDLIITDINLNSLKNGVEIWSQYFSLVRNRMILTSSIEYEEFAEMIPNGQLKPLYIKKPLNQVECTEIINRMLEWTNEKNIN